MKDKLKTIIVGAISGWLLYTILVFAFQKNLERKIANVETFIYLFQGDPAYEGLLKLSNITKKFDDLRECISNENGIQISPLSWRISRNLGVISKDVSESNLDPKLQLALSKMLCKESISILQHKKGITILIEFLKNAGGSHTNLDSTEISKIVTKILANSPFAFRDFKNSLEKEGSKSIEESNFLKKFLSYIFPPEINKKSWKKHSEKELLSLLYKELKVGKEEFDSIDPNQITEAKNYDQFNDVALKLTLLISNHDSVISAKELVMMFKGVIQLLIFIVFGIAIMHIFFISEEEEKHKPILNTLKTTLPTLGFIGTIIGLMKSLGQAYKIPLSSGGADTAIAISEITTALGLAFTTTLLAFILLIIVDFLALFKLNNFWK